MRMVTTNKLWRKEFKNRNHDTESLELVLSLMDTNMECKKQIFKFQKKKIWMKGKKRVHCQQNTENKNNTYTHKPLNSTKFIVFFITMESYDKNENGYSLMDFQPYFVIWSKCTPNDFFSNWTQIKKKYLCDTININILCKYIHFCANMVR